MWKKGFHICYRGSSRWRGHPFCQSAFNLIPFISLKGITQEISLTKYVQDYLACYAAHSCRKWASSLQMFNLPFRASTSSMENFQCQNAQSHLRWAISFHGFVTPSTSVFETFNFLQLSNSYFELHWENWLLLQCSQGLPSILMSMSYHCLQF